MAKIMRGIVSGKTIVLMEDPEVPTGQEVEVSVTAVPTRQLSWGEGLRRCAGALADDWTDEDDRILEEIYRERKRDKRTEPIG